MKLTGDLTILAADLSVVRTIPAGDDLVALAVADVDRDERPDLVALDFAASAAVIARAAADFAVESLPTVPAPEHLDLTDFDGDGTLDLLTQGRTSAEVFFHANDGRGTFATARALVPQSGPSEGFVAHRDAAGRRWLISGDGVRLLASEFDERDQFLDRVIGPPHDQPTGVARDGDAILTRAPGGGARHSLTPAHLFTEVWRGSGGSHSPIALADFNADDLLDLAVTRGSEIAVRLGQPDTTWSAPADLELPADIVSLAAADVTGDGLLDLVIGDASPAVTVAVGRGDAGFAHTSHVPLPVIPWRLHAGFDPWGAGSSAVALAPRGVADDAGLTVLRFDPAGELLSLTRPIAAGDPRQLASADVDADGRDDLVALVYTDTDRLLVTLDGVEGPGTTIALTDELQPYFDGSATLALGDLDRDGTVDALLLDYGVHLELPHLAADPPIVRRSYDSDFSWASRIALADIDHDPHPDLVYCSVNELRVALGAADGRFQHQPRSNYYNDSCALHVDPDGRPTAATRNERGLAVLRPTLAPALQRSETYPGAPTRLTSLATGDLDADARTDILVTTTMRDAILINGFGVIWGGEQTPTRAAWHRVGGDRRFTAVTAAPLDDTPGDEVILASAGHVELLTHRDGHIIKSAARFHFAGDPLALVPLTHKDGPPDLAILGVADDAAHLVVVPDITSKDSPDPPSPLWEVAIAPDRPESSLPPAMIGTDFDADGHTDLVVAPGEARPLRVFWGDRDGTSTGVELLADPERRWRLAAADTDGDGVDELVLAADDHLARVDLRGRVPRVPTVLLESFIVLHFLADDLDGDGLIDFVGGYRPLRFILDASPVEGWILVPDGQLAAAHLDGDSVLDLLGITADTDRLWVRRSAPEAP
ncbi:MAG: VCBS repeat-containing protein [Myxococcales bacterium]|nr:VCBS repeat-containing protein [Myxococcales bacterium]